MAIKDIVELESKGTSVPVAPVSTVQEIQRSRGHYVQGRQVPSKRLKALHRRVGRHHPLRAWAMTLKGEDYNLAQQWFRNKAETG